MRTAASTTALLVGQLLTEGRRSGAAAISQYRAVGVYALALHTVGAHSRWKGPLQLPSAPESVLASMYLLRLTCSTLVLPAAQVSRLLLLLITAETAELAPLVCPLFECRTCSGLCKWRPTAGPLL